MHGEKASTKSHIWSSLLVHLSRSCLLDKISSYINQSHQVHVRAGTVALERQALSLWIEELYSRRRLLSPKPLPYVMLRLNEQTLQAERVQAW